MNIEKLQHILSDQPAYRLKQAKKAIFIDLIEDWDEATVFPKDLREKLNKECPLDINATLTISKDANTKKILIKLDDNNEIETVLMKNRDRNTVCVSTQVGCALKCAFCATGKMGLTRDLKASEIVAQVLLISRHLKKKKEHVTNVVFMGMGEPLLNYDATLDAVRILNDKDGLHIGARKISISTSGIIPGIKKLANEDIQVNLAISLHAPNDRLRQELMPIARKYSLEELFQTIDEYIKKTNRKVMFEYVLIREVNDLPIQAKKLAKLMRKPLYMVNLIPYNETDMFEPSSQAAITRFKNFLLREGIEVTERKRFGRDISAACGQLSTKK